MLRSAILGMLVCAATSVIAQEATFTTGLAAEINPSLGFPNATTPFARHRERSRRADLRRQRSG